MCNSHGCSGHHAPTTTASATAASAAFPAVPPAPDPRFLLDKFAGELKVGDKGLELKFLQKPLLPCGPIVTALNNLGQLFTGTYEPGGMLGSYTTGSTATGVMAAATICTTDWKSKFTQLADNVSSCYSGVTSNLSRLTTKETAPWLLAGAVGVGLATWAYKSYYSAEESKTDEVPTTKCGDAGCTKTHSNRIHTNGATRSTTTGTAAEKAKSIASQVATSAQTLLPKRLI